MKLALLLLMFPTVAWTADPTPPAPFILPNPPTPAPPPVPPNQPVQLQPGYPFVIRANVNLAVVASPDGLVKVCNKPEPVTIVDAGGNSTDYSGDKSVYVISAVKSGSGELLIVTPDGTVTRLSMVVGTPTPPTPPVPPVPPTPPPSPLTAAFQLAYNADTDADKVKSLAFLQSAYKGMAAQAGSQPIATAGDMQTWMKGVVEAPGVGLTATQLVNTRKAVAAELTSQFGTAPTQAVTPAGAALELNRIAAGLAGVKS